MKILSIGNSFSVDATRYLHQIARCDGFDLTTVNLFIGGCPLIKHYQNMLGDYKNYTLHFNGFSTELKVSIKDALLSNNWDYVTLQQASHASPKFETYEPYLTELAAYVRKCAPKAKIAIHQTWSYEQDSKHLKHVGYEDQLDMFNDIKNSYNKAFESINADLILPSGEILQKLIKTGVPKVHRDSFHASFGLGRYSMGLLWYSILSGNDVANNTFCDFDEPVSEEEIATVKKCVTETVKEYN